MTLIDALRSTFRRLHYSPHAEEAYLFCIRALMHYHRCHSRDLSAARITAFRDHLAVQRRVAASTRNPGALRRLVPVPARARPSHAGAGGTAARPPPLTPPRRALPPGGLLSPRSARPRFPPDRRAAPRQRPPLAGVPGHTHQGRGPRASPVHGPPRQGRTRSSCPLPPRTGDGLRSPSADDPPACVVLLAVFPAPPVASARDLPDSVPPPPSCSRPDRRRKRLARVRCRPRRLPRAPVVCPHDLPGSLPPPPAC